MKKEPKGLYRRYVYVYTMVNIRGLRNERLLAIEKLIEKAESLGDFVDKEKLIADLSMRWGAARRTILEYVTILKNAGKIEEKRDPDFPVIVLKSRAHETKDIEKKLQAEKEAEEVLKELVDKEGNENEKQNGGQRVSPKT